MEFASPQYGWWLAGPIAVLLMGCFLRQRQKDSALRHFAEPHLMTQLLPPESRWRRTLHLVLPGLVMILLMLALMRPQSGVRSDEQLTGGLDIVIAIDVSRSMLADDLTPSRLHAAKKAVEHLLDQLAGDRIGLVAFAGSAFQICPLTSDYAIVRQMLADLGSETIPYGGSSVASALAEARRSFHGTRPESRVLIMLSDGEDHAGGIAAELQKLRLEKVAIYAALVGTAAGELMPLPERSGFVKDREGNVVKSRALLATLELIDPAPAIIDIDGHGLTSLLVRAREVAMATVRKERRLRPEERYQIPLAIALLFWSADLIMQRRRHTT